MKKARKPFSLEEAKIQASLALKSLSSENALTSAKRFKRLAEFAHLSIDEIPRTDIKYKHALALVALENGFSSWADLKIQMLLITGGYLNLWFANYKEAKAVLEASGGFLLPYKNQFYIANADYIKQIGLDPKDPDWQCMGFDWVHPKNKKAWQRLYKKISAKSADQHP